MEAGHQNLPPFLGSLQTMSCPEHVSCSVLLLLLILHLIICIPVLYNSRRHTHTHTHTVHTAAGTLCNLAIMSGTMPVVNRDWKVKENVLKRSMDCGRV